MTRTLPAAVARLVGADARTDAGLVAAFLRDADQAAFAELVRRHGPMVFGVCRRTLGHTADADDAFQATFLVLVRRARRVAWQPSLGPWLYGVAVRVARKARAVRGRRAAVERPASAMTSEPATMPPEPDDAAAVLDEELAALPEAVRVPLVLCELQGLSRRDAARQLGLAEGTLSSRLARGRTLLRGRLARRGVVPMAGGLCVAVPAELASATAGRAVAVLAGAAGAVPAGILSLTDGVTKMMAVSAWKLGAVAVAVGVGLTGFGAWQGGEPTPGGIAVATAADPPAKVKPKPAGVEVERDAGKPVATIFGDRKLTKEEFADHLIRRYGEKELKAFVNRQIVATAFARKGLTLTADEVEAAFAAQLKSLDQTREKFEADVLSKTGKTMTMWLEDVVVPGLMLDKLSKGRVAPPADAELRAAFECEHGEKLETRMICWPPDQKNAARAAYEKVKADPQAFLDAAAEQADPRLAKIAGRGNVMPRAMPAAWEIAGDDDPAVTAAAKLRPGEVSPLFVYDGTLGPPRGWYMVVRCDKVIPADATKSFEKEKPALLKEVAEMKLKREVGRLADELKKEAKPQYHLTFPDAATK